MEDQKIPEGNPENLPVETPKAEVLIVDGKFAPTDFDGLYRLATIMTSTNMVPEDYQRNPAGAFVAMQMGMEVGLSFMASLQSIAVVKGKPTIYADGVTGLIQGSGKLENMEEGFRIGDEEIDTSDLPFNLEEWDDNLKAYCIMKRKGHATPYKGSFSVADAKRMGKWNKPTKKGYKTIWQQHPARMLTWRARTFPCRDGFSDVLKGLSVYEEVVDYDADLKDTNGKYEVTGNEGMVETHKEELDVMSSFNAMVFQSGLDESLAGKFLEISATAADCSIVDIADQAMFDFDKFTTLFWGWVKKNGLDVAPEVDDQSGNLKEPRPAIEIVDPPKEEKDPVDSLKDQLYIYLEKKDDWDPENFPAISGLLDNYVEYCAELTKKPAMIHISRFLNNGVESWVGFFLGWIEDMELQSTTKKDAVETKEDTKEEAPKEPRALESPTETLPPGPKQSFKKKWHMKISNDFIKFVKANPEKFDPETIGQEEYLAAKKKWNQIVYARTKEEWPYTYNKVQNELPVAPASQEEDPPKSDIEFPEQSVKQRFAELSIQEPDNMKRVLGKRNFAKGGLTDDAMQIAIDDVLKIIGGEVVK